MEPAYTVSFNDIPDDVLSSVFSYLSKEQLTNAIAFVNKSTRSSLCKLSNKNDFWKMLVETLLDKYLPIDDDVVQPHDWKTVYSKLVDYTCSHVRVSYFFASCQYGYVSIVQLLLEDPETATDIVQAEHDERINVRSEGLILASVNNHIDIVRLLVADQCLDLGYKDRNGNDALGSACARGHIDIVRLLLADPRLAVVNNSHAIDTAAKHNQLAVVKFLLTESTVDPDEEDGLALTDAAAEGHIEVVKMLLADVRVNSEYSRNNALLVAVEHNQVGVIRLLIDDYNTNPANNNNEAIIFTIER